MARKSSVCWDGCWKLIPVFSLVTFWVTLDSPPDFSASFGARYGLPSQVDTPEDKEHIWRRNHAIPGQWDMIMIRIFWNSRTDSAVYPVHKERDLHVMHTALDAWNIWKQCAKTKACIRGSCRNAWTSSDHRTHSQDMTCAKEFSQ